MFNIDAIENPELKENIIKELHDLKKQASLAEQLNDACIDQLIAFDPDRRIISCNQTYADRWNTDKRAVIGTDVMEALPPLAINTDLKKAVASALAGYKVFVPHDKGFHNYGYFETHFIPVKKENGTLKAVLIVIHDVAHRIKAENELQQLNNELAYKNNELKELNRDILAFAYLAGNDLKWPLRKIYSFAEIILQDEGASLTARAKSYCRKIQSASQKMGLLADDIGALSILEPDTFKKAATDLNVVLYFVKNEMKSRLADKNIRIEAPALPLISASLKHMEKLFYCLINYFIRSNADRPSLLINITGNLTEGREMDYPPADHSVNYHVIAFSNNGGELKASSSEDVFNLYSYVSNPQSQQNTGIELALSKKICEMHNGFITLESTTGNGAVFNCYFPAE